MVTCYPSYDMTPPLPSPAQCASSAGPMTAPMAPMAGGKDYSRPLHVDCSVEYELPDAAKPPAGQRSEPLLMIHPCYYRRAEAQRRTRFVNNLPKSLSSPITSTASSTASSSGRRSKVARLASSSSAVEPAWPQPKPPVPVSVPVYPSVPGVPGVPGLPSAVPSSCYKVGATADFSAAYRTPMRTPAAPSSAKLDAGSVLSDIIASTCSEINNNYMKQHTQSSQGSSQQPSSSSQGGQAGVPQPYERASGPAGAPGSCAGAGYQPLPGYHPHHDNLLSSANCKTCQYQPSHHHHHHHHSHHPHHLHTSSSSSTTTTTNSSITSRQPSQQTASQATQNRLYGGGLVKAVEPTAEIASTKVRRCGVKRSRSSRTTALAAQDCARATPSCWSDAMLQFNASGLAMEAAGAGTGAWYGHQGAAQHHGQVPVAVAAPVPGATAVDPLGPPLAWGAMFPHCREREDDTRVLWNSDSLLRLVPV